MPQDTHSDLHLLLGRVEGKVDTLVSLHTSLNNRLENAEVRIGKTETRVAALEARGAGARTWIGWAIAAGIGLLEFVTHFIKGPA